MKAPVADTFGIHWSRLATGVVALICGALIAATILLIAQTYRYGTEHDIDRFIARNGHAVFWDGICAMVSREKFGMGRHVCSPKAMAIQQQAGLYYDQQTLDRIGKTLPELIHDTEFLNAAIDQVFAIDGGQQDNNVRPLGWGADVGYADYMELSFFLFGKRLQSLNKTYFLILALSTVLISIQFRSRPFVLFTVFSFIYALKTFINIENLDYWSIDTTTNPRFLTTLAILPFLHILFLLVHRYALTTGAIFLILPQAILMAFVMNLRTTAYWTIIVIAILSALLAVIWFMRRENRPPLAIALARFWPAYISGAALAAMLAFIFIAEDPWLAIAGNMRTHTFWGSSYYALQMHPDWKRKYAEQHQGTSGDGPAVVALHDYMDRNKLRQRDNPEAYRPDGGLKLDYRERYLGGAFFDFFRNDPGYVIEVFAYNNPVGAWQVVTPFTKQVWRAADWKLLVAGFLTTVAVLIRIWQNRERPGELVLGGTLLFIAACLSAGPNIATVIIHSSITDTALMATTASLSLALIPFFLAGGFWGIRTKTINAVPIQR